MIPANKLKEISGDIHSNYVGGDSDGLPFKKPLLIICVIIGLIYLYVLYF